MHLSWSRWRLSGGRPAREQIAYESLGLVVRIEQGKRWSECKAKLLDSKGVQGAEERGLEDQGPAHAVGNLE
ncbi:hypothetical protein HZ326_14929 [Fusarium oxysporum f. sp. albedinis]|nr:hypothetical protein HZ326_14929 [Fusarium oxysporum f. sp. albedinis]